jgi:hypothetical protein
VAVVNLDPANDRVPYAAAVDVRDLVATSDVMARLGLGPNGGTRHASPPSDRETERERQRERVCVCVSLCVYGWVGVAVWVWVVVCVCVCVFA